jgi:hypothetical protein
MVPLEHAVADLNLNGRNGQEAQANGGGVNGKENERLIIGVDFGTTYSG